MAHYTVYPQKVFGNNLLQVDQVIALVPHLGLQSNAFSIR